MSDIVTASHVFFDDTCTSVDDVLSFFAAKAAELGCAADKSAVFEAFKAREAEGTTGLTEGFAIPHAKTSEVKEATILVAKFANPIAWASMDDKPVHFAISLLIPAAEAGTTHLQLLSKIAVMLMDAHTREALMACDDAEGLAAMVNKGVCAE